MKYLTMKYLTMKNMLLIFVLFLITFIFYSNYSKLFSFQKNKDKYEYFTIKNISLALTLFLIILIFYLNYSKIPSFENHVNRNKYNVFPKGKLINIKDNKYIDENNVTWIKRGFMNSLLHNPFKYYVFETYDTKKQSSSEVEILKNKFDNGNQKFKPASFNYYSSFNSPISHFFADVLPIIIYLSPKYKN